MTASAASGELSSQYLDRGFPLLPRFPVPSVQGIIDVYPLNWFDPFTLPGNRAQLYLKPGAHKQRAAARVPPRALLSIRTSLMSATSRTQQLAAMPGSVNFHQLPSYCLRSLQARLSPSAGKLSWSATEAPASFAPSWRAPYPALSPTFVARLLAQLAQQPERLGGHGGQMVSHAPRVASAFAAGRWEYSRTQHR